MLKEEVLKAYHEQKEKCLAEFPTLTSSWTYFVQIEAAVDDYYSNVDGVSDSVRALIRAAYVSLARGGLKCADDEKYGINYPSTIDKDMLNLDVYWYAWPWLDNLVDKIKYTVAVEAIQPADNDAEKIVDAEQPELELILDEIHAARIVEATQIADLAESLWQSSGKMDFIALVEDRGMVVETPDKKALVKELYLDCNLLKQTQDNNLDVYIPGYVEGDKNA